MVSGSDFKLVWHHHSFGPSKGASRTGANKGQQSGSALYGFKHDSKKCRRIKWDSALFSWSPSRQPFPSPSDPACAHSRLLCPGSPTQNTEDGRQNANHHYRIPSWTLSYSCLLTSYTLIVPLLSQILSSAARPKG